MSRRRIIITRAAAQEGSALGIAHKGLLIAGTVMLCIACILLDVADGEDPVTQALGRLGLGALLLGFVARVIASFRGAGPAGELPRMVGRRRLSSTRALRAWMAATLTLAVGIPLVVAIAVTALSPTGWLWVVPGVVLGAMGKGIEHSARRRRRSEESDKGSEVPVLLERLCMRADMSTPAVVIVSDRVATAWTAAGQLHLTTALLELLDGRELEAVIAHEIAHIAHRDAAVMDVANAPSRLLLGGVSACVHPDRLRLPSSPDFREKAALRMIGLIYVPVGLLLGWSSRLLVLGLSRARELSADTAAATLTGRPSALASALMKLDPSRLSSSRTDLRAIEALCIVEVGASRRGRLLHTHPPISERIERLQAMEARLQARPL
ncbi:MAG: M48 family metalloprotease [Thermoleophilaceae bacterium]|nr:M48 family metalloprotease [Thermoleophilaceae bacterium]